MLFLDDYVMSLMWNGVISSYEMASFHQKAQNLKTKSQIKTHINFLHEMVTVFTKCPH